jgi:hypothetical protein
VFCGTIVVCTYLCLQSMEACMGARSIVVRFVVRHAGSLFCCPAHVKRTCAGSCAIDRFHTSTPCMRSSGGGGVATVVSSPTDPTRWSAPRARPRRERSAAAAAAAVPFDDDPCCATSGPCAETENVLCIQVK